MKNTVKLLYLFIFIGIIVLIVFLTGRSKLEAKKYEEIRSEAIETYSTEATTKVIEETIKEVEITTESEETTQSIKFESEEIIDKILDIPSISVDYEKMKNINEDYKCWIHIPETKISYPVVMTSDNDFYLHRTFDTKEYAYAGTMFIDAYSTYILNQDNLIIYGHNMKDGSMLGGLQKFKNKDYFDNHEYIEIYTKDEIRIYRIFAVREVSSDIDTLNFALDDFDKKTYVDSAIEEAVQSRFISVVNDTDQIITLSTCVGDYSRRLLVSGLRVQ